MVIGQPLDPGVTTPDQLAVFFHPLAKILQT